MKKTSSEIEAEIVRLYHAEQWKVGTIATQLRVHHTVVRRVLHEQGLPVPKLASRSSMVDPYLAFIHQTLECYPKLPASRLFAMVKQRGYPGQESHFRNIVKLLRPKPKHEAFLRLATLPGEQAQVDWGHFGTKRIGRANRQLLAFVMVLSHSRRIFLHFFFGARMPVFLRGHVEAFEYFRGVPRTCLYDNLKSAVTERVSDAIRFNETFLELARHYRFGPRVAGPRRGNEKGRVERAIRYIRSNFFPAREFTTLDALNKEARQWCEQVTDQRRWPDDHERTVIDVFEDERAKLLALPDNPFPCEERVPVSIGKTPYVRFDLNDYSVPHDNVRRDDLAVVASLERIRVCRGLEVIAEHERCWDKGQRIEDPRHIAALVAYKRNARAHHGLGRLQQAAPASVDFMSRAAERGLNLGTTTAQLLRLLDEYGAAELDAALAQVNSREVVHAPAVRTVLEQRRHAKGRAAPVAVTLPDDPRIRGLVVRPHDLATYDHLDDGDDDGQDDQSA
ncbi:MAG: IS21 family transposase [Enhygromyxa sp.]